MDEKLIEAVRGRRILYDTSHGDYMRSKLKSEQWKDIAKEAGLMNGAVAKSKWEKLRHAFRDALRRQKRMKRSGAPAEAIKLWKYQKEMGFLQPFMANRKREGNLQDDSNSDDSDAPNESFQDSVSNDPEQLTMNTMSDNEEFDIFPPSSSTASSSNPPATPSNSQENEDTTTRKKNAKKNTTAIAALLRKNFETRQKMSAQRSEERKQLMEEATAPKDPLYHFFITMYETTKRMPLTSQCTVKNKIFQVVSNMEESLLGLSPAPAYETQNYLYPSSHSNSPSQYSSSNTITTTESNEENRDTQYTLVNLINNFSETN
nr:unnamed protein product [Callosobruchus chinensis]CAH7719288.1 unnamed protein product [Callosobruchus chinensis]CAH7727159.1 unnamed protein product [Callosobruchus chinensis]CAH7742586.1 unnamed protein product [Callosobruchus chinensis]CAH7752187.1 unnamed protein product [Callosobruchus chinensis]